MTEFRGARGSNAGDDYHELWATRHAIRLLDERDPLQALAVEGLAPVDEASASEATWDGVDCTLYEGGLNAAEADRVVLEQLKYSGSSPEKSWTVARLTQGDKREDAVINRLARAWSGIRALKPKGDVEVSLVTNQRIAPQVVSAISKLADGVMTVPRRRPAKDAADEVKLAFAAGLPKADLPKFAEALSFDGKTGSRFAIEEQVLGAMTAWTDLELQQAVAELRQFIRQRMRPEFAGELITKESILLGLRLSTIGALFPCPPKLTRIEGPIDRASVSEAAQKIVAGEQRLCLHGRGGIGKTTALQQVEASLPENSVMVVFDCYGAGSYLDPGALRHRPIDAFLQLSNELATKLRLPILLGRHQVSDPARLFANRLRHAAAAHAAEHAEALVVVAVDAADNAVTAATSRRPPEPCFVHDFVNLGDLPENVRLIVTARTGRLHEIALPSSFHTAEIQPFTREETAEHVRSTWLEAPSEWLDTFHKLTGGVPRVQAYALDLGDQAPENAIDRLLPGGRSLDQVFREQFERALDKSGSAFELSRVCAGLVALARPVPLEDLSGVLGVSVPMLIDIFLDMAPAIRLGDGEVGFADEDFEHFVRREGGAALPEVTPKAADWLFARCGTDAYAALNVAGALVAADRGADLLELVEREPAPAIVRDPVQQREAELTRLRLAISVCRKAGDTARALRFVLIGGEGLRTERALRALLSENPDLAVRFAPETAGRLILTDPEQVGAHGAFLLHRQVVNAESGDRVALREGGRLISAWMDERRTRKHRDSSWRLETSDIAANVESMLRARGATDGWQALESWRPRRLRFEVARTLIPRFLAEGRADLLQSVLDTGLLRPLEELFILVPMAMAGLSVDADRLAAGVRELTTRSRFLRKLFSSRGVAGGRETRAADLVMTACELLARDTKFDDLVECVIEEVLRPFNRSIAAVSADDTGMLDLLFRAHSLKQARAGATPVAAGLYEPRPDPVDKSVKRKTSYHEDEADRRLGEATASVFGIYSARALALAGAEPSEPVEDLLKRYAEHRRDESWRFSTNRSASALSMVAARSLLALLALGVDLTTIADLAIAIHGRWGNGDLSPDVGFAASLASHSALHARLVQDVDASVSQIRQRRMGAYDKTNSLVAYARILLPISSQDANAVFNYAVEAASQLDREIIPQLSLLGAHLIRGVDNVTDRRSAARDLSEIMADAAIRLSGSDEMPWEEVMGTLATLDFPLALANVAKWEDADLASYRDTLPPVLKTGLSTSALQPAAAMALDLMLHGDHGIDRDALESLRGEAEDEYLEEAAWDALVRHDQKRSDELLERVGAAIQSGPWSIALKERHAFLSSLSNGSGDERRRGASDRPGKAVDVSHLKPTWTRGILLNPEELQKAIKNTFEACRATERYVPVAEIVGWAAEKVDFRDRVAFLESLSSVKAGVGGEVVETMLRLLQAWNSPGTRGWSSSSLSDVIVSRFPEFVRYIPYGETSLPLALELCGASPSQTVDLLLRGVELHGEALGGEQVFALAGLISAHLSTPEAAELGIWYARRLAGRIAPEDRDQTWDPADVPTNAAEAVARFIYACLGDYDVRVRWRAAHAIRRLAKLSATEELKALVDEYGRLKETAYRSPALEFYWIAARLWFVIAWGRIADERPQIGQLAAASLLNIAFDEGFPHVLVRSFARDACLKLVEAGHVSLEGSELDRLKMVARSSLAPQPEAIERPRKSGLHRHDEKRRFRFDTMDTIPSWYDPVLRGFSSVSLEKLLSVTEEWIIDRWGYRGDISAYDAELRRHRFSNRDWSLTSNRSGSNPTLERLNTHLEWHGLWCAVGELMRSEPLVARDEPGWDDLPGRIEREMLSEPPLWLADLRIPTPLRPDFWMQSAEPVPEWVHEVREPRMRGELQASDRPEYLVVDGRWDVRTFDRVETVSFSSALVNPDVADAFVRACQTMESAWDYGLPDEGDEDSQDHHGPYQLVGWLRSVSSEGGVDDQDPLRGGATIIDMRPGKRVTDACGLARDPKASFRWQAAEREPMFVYEVWGERDSDDDRYSSTLAVSGKRLLVEKAQLFEFLQREELDLVVEVEIRREGRGNQRSYDEEDDTPEAAYDRLYRLDRTGGLHVAEGRVGTWASDSPAT